MRVLNVRELTTAYQRELDRESGDDRLELDACDVRERLERFRDQLNSREVQRELKRPR